ncbi:MAG: hypothetical protein V4505_15345 [Pseudomonadota bacterium]
MTRYAGKPFLRLLECYVLDAIGQLDDGTRSAMDSMEPKLAKVYQRQGTWQEIVRGEMDFPPSFPETIRGFWGQYSAEMARRGETIDANAFAMSFIDQNFPDIGS